MKDTMETINEMVRDFCSVVPKSKSEVRRRIENFRNSLLDELLSEVGEDEEQLTDKDIEEELKRFTQVPFGEKGMKDYTKTVAEMVKKLTENKERSRVRAIINHKKLR